VAVRFAAVAVDVGATDAAEVEDTTLAAVGTTGAAIIAFVVVAAHSGDDCVVVENNATAVAAWHKTRVAVVAVQTTTRVAVVVALQLAGCRRHCLRIGTNWRHFLDRARCGVASWQHDRADRVVLVVAYRNFAT
jgi:hypothetical protein